MSSSLGLGIVLALSAAPLEAAQSGSTHSGVDHSASADVATINAEVMLRTHFEALRAGKPHIDAMTAELRKDILSQRKGLARALTELGSIQSLSFTHMKPDGSFEFVAKHEAAKARWEVVIAPDGKLSGLWYWLLPEEQSGNAQSNVAAADGAQNADPAVATAVPAASVTAENSARTGSTARGPQPLPRATSQVELAAQVRPFSVLRDCPSCPEMVVVPAGTFLMGTDNQDPYYLPSEGPQHEVTIARPFAMGRFEVTGDQYQVCVRAGACTQIPPYGRAAGRRPVTNLTLNQMQEYTQYLTRITSKTYTIPTEDEWEYAARAGSQMPWSTGETVLNSEATINLKHERETPVGSYAPNAFGLYDMIGNAAEAVIGKSYANPRYPSRLVPTPELLVVRGGSWRSTPANARSAARARPRYRNGVGEMDLGFRVARTLTEADVQIARPNPDAGRLRLARPEPASEQRLARMQQEAAELVDNTNRYNDRNAAYAERLRADTQRRLAELNAENARIDQMQAEADAELAAMKRNSPGPRNIVEAVQQGLGQEVGRQQELNRQSQHVVNQIAAMELAEQRRREAEKARRRAAQVEGAAERQRLARGASALATKGGSTEGSSAPTPQGSSTRPTAPIAPQAPGSTSGTTSGNTSHDRSPARAVDSEAPGKPLRFMLYVPINHVINGNNAVCYSNVVTLAGPPGWNIDGEWGAQGRARNAIKPFEAGFLQKCRAKGHEVRDGSLTIIWNEEAASNYGPNAPEQKRAELGKRGLEVRIP